MLHVAGALAVSNKTSIYIPGDRLVWQSQTLEVQSRPNQQGSRLAHGTVYRMYNIIMHVDISEPSYRIVYIYIYICMYIGISEQSYRIVLLI